MPEVNKFGLVRAIPNDVKRAVRQRCGFGCVRCGRAIYQYEHFSPEFAEAHVHAPEGITLLCASCHELKTKGLLASSTVAAADANPRCLSQGFSFGPFDLGASTFPQIDLGTLQARNVAVLLRIFGDEILSIRPPEAPGAPFCLNAFLCDSDGEEVLRIVDNEWQTHVGNWNVEVVGPRISVRRGPGDIALTLRTEPPDKLVVERLNMSHKGTAISCQEGHDLRIRTASGGILSCAQVAIHGSDIGIDLNEHGLTCGVGGGSVRFGKAVYEVQPGGRIPTISFAFRGPPPPRRVGRNDPCPCGSSKKFKHCHGRLS